MAERKRQWNMPSMHRVPALGDKALDEVAALSDDQLQEYLNANGFGNAARTYRANPSYVFREVAGEKLLIPINEAAKETSCIISLTETGGFLWKLMEEAPQTKEELSIALRTEYGITYDIAATDVSAFVDKAVISGIVVSLR